MEQELYKIFGSRSEYRKAPFAEVQKHRLVVLARWEVEAEQQQEADKELEEMRRKAVG